MLSFYDLKTALLKLFKDYEYTLIVVITMALCLGVSMFLYAQVYSMSFKPLPYSEEHRWIQVSRMENGHARSHGALSRFEVNQFRQHQNSLEVYGWWSPANVTINTGSSTFNLRAARAHSSLFTLTATSPHLGRTINSQDEIPGAEPVMVLGYEVWLNAFAQNPKVINSQVQVDGIATRIVGVMPEGFAMPGWHALWLADSRPLPNAPSGGWHTIYGLLKPGVSLDAAKQDFSNLSKSLERQYPTEFQGKSVYLDYYTKAYTNNIRIATWIMTVVAVAILALGCFSVGNLLLARSMENSRETAIKSALGLPLTHIVSTTLLETFILCLCAGALGMIFCQFAITYLARAFDNTPFWWQLHSGFYLYAACFLFVGVTWFITGVIPTWLAFKGPSSERLAGGNKGGTQAKTGKLAHIFVALQVLCAIVLMVFTGITTLAFIKILQADYGINTENYLSASIKLPNATYPKLTDRIAYYERLTDAVKAIPGVIDTAYTGGRPGHYSYLASYQALDREILVRGSSPKATEIPVSDNYFDLMGIKLLEGRAFTIADTKGEQSVATISERMAQNLWPTQTRYVGRQFQLNPERNGPILTVVGIAAKVVYGSPIEDDPEDVNVIYRPMYQVMPSFNSMEIMIKTRDNPLDYIKPLQDAGRQVDASIAINAPDSLEHYLEQNSARTRDFLLNFIPAALLALLMAGLGIYGITKRSVLQKTPEAGILKAIGISDARISWSFLKISAMQFIAGAIPGVIFVFFALPAIINQTIKISFGDLFLVAATNVALIGLIVLLASYLPLLKLHRLSPKEAISYTHSD